ncbi:YDG domain-containing protein [Zoogloea sp. 1C4]|uniref:YDG domain-containing protein n=1 Tax=Zoogloea sp. 1C4 TaxID=2570190 RepID=UPI0012929F2D|nr:YDG domain-containing protein [Zoogloea sp. 1C4]
MNGHASMNRIYRLVWSHRHDAWVVVAEIARGRGKSSGVTGSEARVGGAAAATVTGEGAGRWRERLLGAALLTFGMNAFAAPPAAGQLPTGGNVVAGQAAISQGGARMDINQASNRAVIDWSSYNVGAAAQVNYNQPSAASATLNRVMDTQASQILGKITANGQLVLVNPNGVYFGKGSSVDVGGLVASTHDVANADFMAGKSSFARNGSTGSVVNEGELRAALGGYIALLAPEVRNEGVIVARMGTVALASGERVTLQFDGNNSLAGIVVEPSKIKALVENKGAVVAPGGVIILSARAVDRLQGGIVRNSGKLEATGMAMKGGKIVLEASDRVENTGTVSADAGRDGSPAGEVSVTAPVVVNSGTISAKGAAATEPVVAGASRSGGRVSITADTVTQTATGKLDVSGADKGGEVTVKAAQDVAVSGTVDATAEAGEGGAVHVEAGNNITLSAATMDVSGLLAGGQVRLEGGPRKAPTAPADNTPPTTAILDSSSLRAGSRRGRGGSITLTGDHVGLFEGAELDASGATGGGTVLVGGDYQGKNPDIANAQATFVAEGAVIRADATDAGNGGKVIVWADGNTRFLGQISAQGGAHGGDGGFAEVSGKGVLDFRGQVNLLASAGQAGSLLLDPHNLTISGGADTIASGFDADGDDSVLSVATLQNALANGNVTVTTGSGGSQAGNITVASTLGWFSNYSLSLTAANNITVNSGVSMIAAGNGNMILTATGGALSNAGTVRTYGGNLTVVAGGAVSGAGVYDVAGTASFTAGGNIDLTTASNRFVGAMSLATTSGSVQLVNSVATVLNGASATSGVSIASGGSITTGGSATGLDSGSGALTLSTASGSNGSIIYTGNVHAGGDTSVSADGLGAISLAHITGAVTVVSASAGGAITLGDSSTGAVTLDSASGNVISGTAGSAGQASGTVSVTGTSITLNDPIRTKGGRVNLTATSGDVTAIAGANIVTTADGDTGTASGVVSVTAQGNVTLQAITTTGANNLLGVGSNAAAVGITATTGDVNVGAITTSGGDATPEASNPTNRNGGNAGNIIIGAPGTGKNIYLNGDLLAIGGGYSGASTQGLGGYIELQTPTILTANRLVSTGATSGNIYALSTIDSDGTARSLTLTAGTGDVRLRGVVGGSAPLSSFTVSSSANTTVEKNLTTNAAGGVTINASYNIHLGDDTVANGSGAMTVDTRTGNGTVTLNTINTWLDDAVTFTRGSGAISVAQNLYSKAAERNDLTFNGTGGGAISVGWDVGGGSVGGANSLGDILVSTGTDLSLNRNVSAKSLVAVNSTGRLLINGSNIYAQYYDGASGLQLQTTGSANNVAGDENVTVYGSVTSTASGAPISIAAPNGTLTLANYADLTTAAGAITLSASGNISNGYDTDLTSTGGAITVSSSAGALNLTGDYLDITTTSGQVNLSGVGVTFGNTGAAGMASTVNAGSGKIRVNGGGGRIQSYGTLTSTDADTAGTSAILLQNAYVATASSGAVVIRAATATGGTLEIGQLSGGSAASNADVRGDVLQYDSGASYSDTINIKTLKVASTTTINVGDNSNIIDELGGVTLGGALTIQAKGRVTGMALTGDVTATGVDIRTGVGALAVGTRNITATTGNVVLRGRGITQSAGSTISSTSGTVTLYGSDYATNTLGDVTLAGTVNAGSNSSAAVTIDDTAAVQLGDITAGVAGNRGGLVLGSNTYQSLNGSGGHWLYANGAVSQAANTAVKVGVIQAFQLGGPLNLSNVTNEIGQVGYVRRGGAITLYDKDAEGNGLLLTNIYDGSYDTLLTATTEGAMTLSGTNRGKGMVLTAGAGGFSASGSIEGHHGGAGKITITTTGGANLTSGTMYAKGIEIYSGAAGIINSVDLQAHHGGGGDLILDAGGGNVTLNNRLYIIGSGNDIFIQNANNVQLHNIELRSGSKVVLGGVGTGVGGADVPLTGNVTQVGRIYSESDTTDVIGAVAGSVNMNSSNQFYRLGYFATGGNFNLYNQDRNLTVVGAVSSASGNVSISNGNYGITLTSTGSLSANAATKSVSVGGYGGNTNGWVNIQGAISAGTGGIALTGGGSITNNSTGTLTTYGISAGEYASGGGNIALTGRGIIQASRSINATGGSVGTGPSTGTSGGTITLTGHDGTASGDIVLSGTVQTASASASAVTIRGTSALALPNISAPNGGLVLGDSTPTIGAITGAITQSATTSVDIKTLNVTGGSSAVLANTGNKIFQLGAISVGDNAAVQYDFDAYDSTSGLSLTQSITSAGGLRLRTATGDGASGALAIGVRSITAHGDVFLGGDSVTQSLGSVIDADSGSIRVDGGSNAFNISLLGTTQTASTAGTAIEIVGATNATLNVVSATAGTVTLGVSGKEVTGTVAQVADTGTLSAATLAGKAGVVTLNKTYLDNLGSFITTGALTLKDLGGAGTAGLKLTGDVVAGAASSIETTDGVLDLDTHSVDATGVDMVLKGIAVSQTTGSSIKSTTASIFGNTGNITLDSALNDFTGQVTVTSTGSQVSIRDANQLSMNALTGKLAQSTSITAIAGTQLVLATENLTTTTGNIEFRSLDGNLTTPGTLTTGSGSVSLYATTSTPAVATNGNVQVNQTITTGSGSVNVVAQKEVNLSKSVISTSGNLLLSGDTITHSTGSAGAPLMLQTGGAGTIDVTASGTGGFVMGQYYSYQAGTGTISITSGSTADLANISSSGAVTVDAVGLVQQVGAGATLASDSLAVTTANNGSITLTNATNDVAKLSLRSRNAGGAAAGSGTITYNDANGFAVRQIETTGAATLTAHGAISTDSSGFPGTVVADTLTVKSLSNSGADIILNAAGNDVNSLTVKVRDAADAAIAGSTSTPSGTIRFTDADGFSVTSVETLGSTVLNSAGPVTQTGAILSAKLGLQGSGSYTLNAANTGVPLNEVSTFASDATGAVNLSSKLALTIGSVNPTGITTGGASISLSAPGIDSAGQTIDTRSATPGTAGGSVSLTTTATGSTGNLRTGNIITSGSDADIGLGGAGGDAGNITLTTAGDTLTVAGAITARGGAGDGAGANGNGGTVRLNAAAGAVSQADGSNEINAGKLLVNAAKASSLLDTTNAVDLVAAKITGVGEGFTYRSGADYAVGGGDGVVTGISTQGGAIDLGSSPVAVTVSEAITTRGGSFSATGVGSFDSSSVAISTLGDITYAAGAYQNGGAINVATTASGGNVHTGTLVTSGSAGASGASAGSVTLNADGVLTTSTITALGQGTGTGTGGAVDLTGGSGVHLAGSIDTSGGVAATAAAGGNISVTGPAQVSGGDRVLSTGAGSGNVVFNGSLDADGTPRGLTVSVGTGNATFSSTVGGTSPLGALVVNSAGTTRFDAAVSAASVTTDEPGTTLLNGNVTTSGAQVYHDIVEVRSGITLGTTNGAVTFDKTVDSETGETNALTVSTGSGNVTFTDVVGSTTTLGAVTVNSTGTTKFNAAVTAASVATNAGGTTQINGNITTTGTQTYNDAVELQAPLTLATTDSAVTFGGSVDSQVTGGVGEANPLTVNAGTGDVSFMGVVGGAVKGAPGAIVVNSGGTTLFNAAVTAASVTTDAPGKTQLGGNITTTGAQHFQDDVEVLTAVSLATTNSAVSFDKAVDSAAGQTAALTVGSGSADVTFSGLVGGTTALGALAVDSTGTTLFADAVRAASVTTNAGGTTRLGGNVTTGGAQTYNDAVELLTGVTVTTTNSAVSFGGTLNSEAGEGNNLTVVAGSGDVSFTGAVGGAASGRLGTLTVTSAHDVTANAISAGALVQTAGSGTTTLNGAVDTDTAAGVSLAGTHLAVNAGITTTNGGGVTLNQSGTTALSASGDINADGAVHITAGGGISTAGDITTNGADVTFASAATLTGPVSINTGGGTSTIQFASTVDSDAAGTPRTLRLATGSGGLNFVAALGGTHALDELRLESAGVITQSGAAPIKAAKLAIKSAGNVTLANTGNDVDVLAALLSGGASLAFVDQDGVEVGTVDTAALQIVGITNTAGSSSVSLTLGGPLTQAVGAPILIGGNLTLDTSAYEAADVAVKNVHAAGTVLDDSLIAGAFTLDSTGAVTQKAGTPPAEDAFLQVGGSFDLVGAGQFSSGNSSKNLIGGGSAAVSGNEIRLFGVITLSMSGTTLQASAFNGVTTSTASVAGAKLASGLQVVSDAGGKTISAVASGNAIVLNDSNNIGGLLKITTKGTFSDSGSSGITGINQSGALDLGAISLIVQQSAANAGSAVSGAGALNLGNAGNQFSGHVAATAVGMNATLNASGDLALGSVTAANLAVGSTGNLTQAANTAVRVGTLAITGAQSVTLDNANRIGTVAASSVSGALSLANAQTLAVGTAGGIDGITASGPVTLRTTSGDIVLDKGITVSGASDITLASAANFTNHAGAAALTVDTGHWQVWSTDPAADTLGGLAPDFKQYDATYGTTSVLGTGNGLLYTLAPELSVALTGSVERVYDSTVTATLVQGNYNVTAGLLAGDAVVFGTAGTFDDKNVGNAKKVSVSPVIDSASAGSIVVYGYKLASGSTAIDANIGKITKATLSAVTGITASDKTYDGNDSATLATGSAGFTGKYAGDVLAVDTATGNFASKNASATSGTVNITGITLTGTDAGNYALADTTASTTATINPFAVSLTGSRVYDGTTVVGTGDLTLGTLVGSETLALSGSGSVATRHVGTGKTVDVSGLSLVGDGTAGAGLASNYTFVGGSQTVDVTKANLSVTTSDVTKTYDGSLSAAGTAVVAAGGTQLFGADNLSGGTFAFTNANAGTSKTVNTSAVTVNDGNSGGNYTVSYVANTTSTIDKAAITVSTSDVTKTYDGTLTAAGTAVVTAGTLYTNASNGGALDNLSGGSFAFTDANAGTGNKTVTVGGVTVNDGASGGNYIVTYASNTTSTINPYAVSLTGSRVYDGTTVVNTGDLTLGTLVGSETLALSGTGSVATRHVGTGKTVDVSGLSLVGDGTAGAGLASNYTFVGGSQTVDVTKANLSVTTSDVTKTYDGSLSAAGTAVVAAGGTQLFGADNLSGGTFAFTNANAGTSKTVNTSAVTVNDGNSGGNYTVSYVANTTSTIDKAAITVSTSNVTKTYDGTLTAAGTAVVTAGTLYTNASNGGALDNLSGGSFAFTDANAGTGNKTVTVGGVTVNDGASGGNYTVTYASNTTSTINPYAVSLTGSRVYDGTTVVGTGDLTLGTLVGSETLTLSGAGSVATRHVGTGKTVDVSGLSLVGDGTAGAGLASNYTFVGGSQTVDVTKANLSVTTSDVTKTYDGSLSAAGTAVVAAGGTQLFGADNLSGGTFAFTNANAGTSKTVNTSAVTVNDGNSGGNYTVSYVANSTSTIDKAAITVSTSDVTKTYDGTLSAAGTAVVTAGTLYTNASNGGALDNLSGGSFAFTDANAGTGNKTVTVGGVTVNDGASGGNYTVTYASNTASTIDKAAITVGTSDVTKAYDGGLSANGTPVVLSGTLYTNASNGGALDSLSGGTYAFTDKNAGSGKTVTVGGVTVNDGASGGNYAVTYASNTTSTIDKAQLTVVADVADRTYDGTLNATLNGMSLVGLVGSETVIPVSAGTTRFADKNAGTGKTVTITGIGLLDGLNGGVATNYQVASTATGTASIVRANVNVVGVVAMDKVYDGTTTATINTSVAGLTGVIGADDVSIGTITGSFDTKNVGANKLVNGSAFVLSGADGGNYNLIQPTGMHASITPRALTVSATGVDKVYDGTTTATVSLADNRVNGDVLTLGYTANFLDKNVGLNKYVGVSGISLSGTDAGNYTANTTTAAFANISKATLNVSAAGINKAYDGNTTASVTLSDNRASGDSLAVSYTGAAFSDANGGLGKTVTVNGISVSGADIGNYTFNTTAITTADILGRLLTISGVQALGKVYDGTTAAVLGTGGAVLSGLLDGDVVSVGLGSGVFADKNAGTGKAVTVTGIALSGANAGSYTLQLPVGLTADITPASLTAVTGITAASKVYDGNVAAALNTGAAGFTGTLAGDVLSVASASGVFADKNAGTGKTVSIGNIVLGGADAGNYVFTGAATTTADITPKAITVSGITASNKVYDATTAATLNTGAASFSGLVGSDSVGVSGTGQFADKNVGTAKAVAITSLVLDGADAGNYTVTTSAAPTADITPRALTADGISAASKVYDGTTAATLDTTAGRLTSGVQGADDVSLVATAATGSFASKNVGVAKAVTVSGLALGGADAGNYTIGDAAAFADITAKALTASGIIAANKVYDGTRVASVDAGAAVLAGVVMGDTVGIDASGVTGSFANKQAGSARAVTIAGLGLTGADAGNYTVSDLSGATADVAARALTVAVSTNGKLYDGSTSAPVSLSDNRLAGDLLNLSYTSASFDTAEVGLGKPIQVQGIALAGADAGNYRLVATTASTTGNISALDSVVPPPPVPATPVTTYTPVQPQAQVFDSALPGTGGSSGVVGGSGGVSGGLAGGSASSGLTGATGGGLGGAGGGLGGSGTASSGLGAGGSGGIASGAGIGSGSGTAGSGGVQAGAPATAGSGGVSGAVSAPAAGSGSGASSAVTSEGSQSGVNVQLLQAPASTQTGLVRVSIPRGESTFVFSVPKDVYAGEGQSALAASTIRMENGSPVPAWIKHDPQSMSVSATNVPPGGLPVRLLLTIGGKVTTVVIGTTDQGGQ